MICRNHKCRKEFTPTHHNARFCGKGCQTAHADWVKSRGGVIANLMLEDPPDFAEKLEEKRLALIKEYNTP